MKCEKEGCNNERVCFHYCHDHHQEICMAGIVNHTELAAAQQSFAPDVCKRCGDTGRAEPTLSEPDGIECPNCTRR